MGLLDYFTSKDLFTDMSALKKAMDETAKNLEKAKYLEGFRDKFPDSFGKFGLAEKKLKKISGCLGKVEKVYGLAQSAEKIKWALKVLDDEYVLRFDSDKAAIAIGILLVEFGEISKNLPPPGNSYSGFLIEFGKQFVDIVNMLTPQKRASQKEIWDSLGFSISAQ